jgi:DNA-binding MarR family transcriptional regulator
MIAYDFYHLHGKSVKIFIRMTDQITRSTPELEEASRAIVLAILQFGRRLRAERPQSSISLSQLAVLATLHRRGPMPAAQLARRERLQPQSLTRVIAEMDGAGLITRHRSESDRRTLMLEITKEGRQILARDIGARRVWLESAMASALSPTEQVLLRLSADLMLKLAAHGATTRDDDAPLSVSQDLAGAA